MIGRSVYVLSFNAGVIGVFASKAAAMREKSNYTYYDYKGVKVEEFIIWE